MPKVWNVSFLTPVDCPKCGAPLPPDAIGASVVTCPYCDGTLAADPRVVWSSAYRRALSDAVEKGVPLLHVGDVPYAVEGRFARGESTDVFLARRAVAPTERVLIKVLRAEDDADLLEREWSVLSALHESEAPGSAHFTGRLPQLVARGAMSAPGRSDGGTATVLRFQSGFVHTLDDVRAAHGDALDPRHAVWIWRRVLELLTWVHAHGVAHGAVLPQHLVLHARDHGVMLVGWSTAVSSGELRPATSAAHGAFYPPGPATPESDVAMSARCIAALLGGDPASGVTPSTVPRELAVLIGAFARSGGDAATLEREVARAARAAFGPPAYVSLRLP